MPLMIRACCAALCTRLVPLGIALTFMAAAPARAAGPPSPRPDWVQGGVHLSAAYERMLRDEMAEGRVLPEAVIQRFHLDLPETEPRPEAPHQALRVPRSGVKQAAILGLAPDLQLNDKSLDFSCGPCGGFPLTQSETTIASLGTNLIAGWNDALGFCTGGAVQGYATSTDGGATWTDFGDVPALPTGGRYRGDPVVGVNRKTGDFYIVGLYQGGAMGSGIALARGHFAGTTFVFDLNTQIAVGGSDFLDKEWLAVDSVSGNLYVTSSNFVGGVNSQIEFIRSIDNGVTWSAPLVLSPPSEFGNVQGSRPVVGPSGEVYVVWYEFGFPLSHMHIRRSDDFGVSFGPERTVADFYENGLSGAPGYRRGFAPTLPGIAVDNSGGPHRGRVYVAWDEAVNFYDAPFGGGGRVSEVENNSFFAHATAFTVGDTLRGDIFPDTDLELFKFNGLRGQTVFFQGDSSANGVTYSLRLMCGADTSAFGNYRFLAFNQQHFPALVFTLPADGTYYLRLTGSGIGRYRIETTFDTPSTGERARDHRDRFVSYSDDGTAWSTPTRLDDDDPWFDGIFPEVTVDGLGRVHAYWHDFRDDVGCGATSYEYMVSSGDGGVTWGPNRRVSDAASFWSANACGSANQGDYQGVTSEGSNFYPCWGDSRLGDPDVFMECAALEASGVCPAPAVAPGGSDVLVAFSLDNTGNVPGSYQWSVSDDNGWLASAAPAITGSVALAAGASQVVTATLKPSSDCYPTPVDTVRFAVSDLSIPGPPRSCATTVTCTPTTAASAPLALSFASPSPNPSRGGVRFAFTLPRAGAARLAIYGAGGTRVRMLAQGALAAGAHERLWDARDERGRRVPPGVYYARLDAEGRSLKRAVVMMH